MTDDDRNYLKALDEVRAERDAALARAEAAEARCATLEAALRLAYPYMEDALEQGGMTDELESIIRADIVAVAAALAASRPAEEEGT